jgi:hypothetical protein
MGFDKLLLSYPVFRNSMVFKDIYQNSICNWIKICHKENESYINNFIEFSYYNYILGLIYNNYNFEAILNLNEIITVVKNIHFFNNEQLSMHWKDEYENECMLCVIISLKNDLVLYTEDGLCIKLCKGDITTIFEKRFCVQQNNDFIIINVDFTIDIFKNSEDWWVNYK